MAAVLRPPSDSDHLTNVVLFPIRCDNGYLAIRYESFEEQRDDGDSYRLTLAEAKRYASIAFNVDEADWQPMSRAQALKIPLCVLGKPLDPDDA